MTQGPSPPQIVVPGQGWVDLFSRVIVQVGFPVVVAGVLLYYLLFRFQTNVELISARMAANTDVAAKLIQADEQLLGELRTQTALLKQMAQQQQQRQP